MLEEQPSALPRLAGKRALIVGASPFEAPFLGERLAAAGAEVARATGADSALARLAQQPRPDIVVVDCALGETAARRLGEAARAAGVPRSLVLISPFERRALGQPMTGYDGWLVKPVRSRSLLERLQSRAPLALGGPEEPPQSRRPPRAIRALLAEDNEINTIIALNFLRRLGAAAVHVGDGASAVDRHRKALTSAEPSFDLILLDLRMPGLDGLSAARALRAAETEAGAAPSLLVAFTANAFDEDRRACAAAGFDEFMTKPIDFEKLAAIVGRLSAPAVGEPVLADR